MADRTQIKVGSAMKRDDWMDLEKKGAREKKRNEPIQENQTLLNTLFQEGTMISIRAKRRAEKSTKTDRWTKNNSMKIDSGNEKWTETETMGLLTLQSKDFL